jgi:hypothetical protein
MKTEDWIDVKDEMPKIKYGWSEQDVFIATLYSYEIGRLKNGVWINMYNKVLEDVTHWMHIALPPHENEEFIDNK